MFTFKRYWSFLLLALYLMPTLCSLNNIGLYLTNIEYIENNLCENRLQPEMLCKGTCILAKMLEDSSDQQNPFEQDIVEETASLLVGYIAQDKTSHAFTLSSKSQHYIPEFSLYRLMLAESSDEPPELI